ncbi:MAG: ABC transporter permease [Mycoplasma sp.]
MKKQHKVNNQAKSFLNSQLRVPNTIGAYSGKTLAWWQRFYYSPSKSSIWRNILVSLISIILATFVALVITAVVYQRADVFYLIPQIIFTSSFTGEGINKTLIIMAIVFLSAISFIFAQKVGLFNIGISGQMLFAGQVAFIIAWVFGDRVPRGLGQIIFIFVAMGAGAFVSLIITLLKEYFNIHEVISSIMLNWIIFFCGTYMLSSVGQIYGQISDTKINTKPLADNWIISLTSDKNQAWVIALILGGIVLLFSFFVLSISTYGKKIASVGKSLTASQYAGISVRKQRIIAMLISGAVAGLMGAIVYGGYENGMSVIFASKIIPHWGFDGISIGLIAGNNSLAALPVALLFAMVEQSKQLIQTTATVSDVFAGLIFGIIVYGAAIIAVFIYFKPYIWLKIVLNGKRGGKNYEDYVNAVRQDLDQLNSRLSTFAYIRRCLLKRRRLQAKLTRLLKAIKIVPENYKSIDAAKIYDEVLERVTDSRGLIRKEGRKLFNDTVNKLWVSRSLFESIAFTKQQIKRLNEKIYFDGNSASFQQILSENKIQSVDDLIIYQNYDLVVKNLYRFYRLSKLKQDTKYAIACLKEKNNRTLNRNKNKKLQQLINKCHLDEQWVLMNHRSYLNFKKQYHNIYDISPNYLLLTKKSPINHKPTFFNRYTSQLPEFDHYTKFIELFSNDYVVTLNKKKEINHRTFANHHKDHAFYERIKLLRSLTHQSRYLVMKKVLKQVLVTNINHNLAYNYHLARLENQKEMLDAKLVNFSHSYSLVGGEK